MEYVDGGTEAICIPVGIVSKRIEEASKSQSKLFVCVAIQRADALTDYNNDLDKQFEFEQQTILADESLTNDEKFETIRIINKYHDFDKILYNEGKERICDNCQEECLAI
ncbi:hypothetical protein C1645_839274 [Glomus cerebriforme]|uniref:Uncharacterized protein n=1 Tax=Glomus cerebriforme TaxID=658196 RepID=A0A397S7Y4_9GLOM|nr:hypothetical protein C1645_839274 [Glomus cerebriforme]